MAPILEEVTATFDNVTLVKVNADTEEAAEALEKYDVRSIPTLVLEDENGRVLDTLVGEVSAKNLTLWIEGNLGILY